MPFVSVTRLHVRSWRYLPAFLVASLRALFQAKRRREIFLRPSSAMRISPSGRARYGTENQACVALCFRAPTGDMPRLLDWCDEAAVVHWTADDAQPPSWPEAHRRLQADGRPSKVKFPSEAQRRFEIPPPRV
jgi:hypothetical protein